MTNHWPVRVRAGIPCMWICACALPPLFSFAAAPDRLPSGDGATSGNGRGPGRFEGRYFSGEGDVEYLRLLDVARRMFAPDPEFQNAAMLYTPSWNGFVEGPKWGAWWIQNSYGPSYCSLPFLTEPYRTFLQNAQDCWFDTMGDGTREWIWREKSQGVVPDGQLCDAATPDWAVHKQGDGRVDIHDWGMEFTAAGLVMQAELLLIGRDEKEIARYLPKLERCADFIESRRDPKNNLFLAGPAGNLLAPSYAGWKRPDGTYDKAYLSGLSVTYIAGLNRLIELEKLAGNPEKARTYAKRRDLAKEGLKALITEEGYFIKYLDPDGTRHGVCGAEKHGYFEAIVNHDAVCFRVADDAQARKIYAKIASIPGLRPHDLILTNYPSLDDMYEDGGIFSFGTWVNGGHWSTCEARAIMAYYRLGTYEDARRSMRRMLGFARRFQMDNPLKNFGATPWFDTNPINLCYDNFGPPAAMIRGLFECLYTADALTLVPHIPTGITLLEQRFPIRFGAKRLFISASGQGDVRSVSVNGRPWERFDRATVTLPYSETPDIARIQILLGGGKPFPVSAPESESGAPKIPRRDDRFWKGEWISKPAEGNALPLRIGADSQGGTRFIGDVGRVMVFSRVLADDEIQKLAQDPRATPAERADLVADWDFARRQGEAFVAGPGDDLQAKSVGEIGVVDAPVGKAVRLSGDGYLEIAHNEWLDGLGSFTLAAWICPGVMGERGGRIIDKCEVGFNDGFLLDTFPGRSLRLITPRGSASYDAQLPAGEWTHVAATYDPEGDIRLFVAGNRVTAQEIETRLPGQELGDVAPRVERLRALHDALGRAGLGDTYEAAHARLVMECVDAAAQRAEMLEKGGFPDLPPRSKRPADVSYVDTVRAHCDGLEKALDSYEGSEDPRKRRVFELWKGRPSADGE